MKLWGSLASVASSDKLTMVKAKTIVMRQPGQKVKRFQKMSRTYQRI